ncbi:MAG TPA: hypothetical protein VJ820_07120 [Propionibacteriaceae bacterium]|nr:hypothetical protein [Propionibacteriaceae bacterium]
MDAYNTVLVDDRRLGPRWAPPRLPGGLPPGYYQHGHRSGPAVGHIVPGHRLIMNMKGDPVASVGRRRQFRGVPGGVRRSDNLL